MANRKKESEFQHDHHVMLRLTKDEYDVLKEDAQQAKMKTAEFARKIINERNVTIQYKVVADMDEIRALGRELNAIGNNLNQIAQYFHTGGARSEYVLQEIHAGVAELEKIRKAAEELAGGIHGGS